MSKKIISLILVLALVFSIALVGCQKAEDPKPVGVTPEGGQEEETPEEPENPALARGNVLTFGESSLDGLFNPIMSSNVYDSYINKLIFRGLALNNTAGDPTPEVAERWEISKDGKTYTFYLKEGVKFHDGEELTAEDVEFTYYTMCNPNYTGPRWSAVADIVGAQDYRDGNADTIEGIKIINDHTISFTINDVNAAKFGSGDFEYGILPKHYYEFEDIADFEALNHEPMGCGPFKFERYVVGQYVEMKAFDDFFKGRAKLDGVIFKIVPDETKAAQIQAGEIDVAQLTADPKQVEIATKSNLAKIHQQVGNGYNYASFNLRLDKFKDKRVRQALMYGLNRQKFIDVVYQGYARPCNTAVSPVSWAYTDKVNQYEYNPDKAKDLLKQAGWEDRDGDGWVENENGEKFDILWTTYTDVEWPQKLIAVAKENWKELGVDLDCELMEFTAVDNKTRNERDFEMYNMGWSLSIDPDPTGIFDAASDVVGGYNCGGFHNDEAEEIIAQGKREMNTEKRKELYQRWAEIANEELPYLFLAYRDELFAINNRVKNLNITPYETWVYYIDEVEVDY